MEEVKKLEICYLSDIGKRMENVKQILLYMERRNIIDVKENHFLTSNAVYRFVNCRDATKAKGILADQVIVDFREPMRTMAVDMLRASCVPEQYQIIDDRDIGAWG